jgi:hypothetical protein
MVHLDLVGSSNVLIFGSLTESLSHFPATYALWVFMVLSVLAVLPAPDSHAISLSLLKAPPNRE